MHFCEGALCPRAIADFRGGGAVHGARDERREIHNIYYGVYGLRSLYIRTPLTDGNEGRFDH